MRGYPQKGSKTAEVAIDQLSGCILLKLNWSQILFASEHLVVLALPPGIVLSHKIRETPIQSNSIST